jgi:CHAT domain-containing protein
MMVVRQKVVIQILLVWIIWHCQAPGVLASANSEQTADRASELLALSEKQNFENHTVALQSAKQSLTLWQELGNNFGIALALGQVARCHLAQSELVEASLAYQQALELWRDQKNLPKQTEILNMMGIIEAQKGDWDSAIDHYMQAQSLMNDESAPALRGQIAGGLAYIFNENGLPEQALIHYRRALEFAKQTESPRDDDRMIMLLGYTYFLRGDHEVAETHLQDALSRLKQYDSLSSAQCQEYLAQLETTKGNYDAALRYLLPSLSAYVLANNPRQATRVQALIGQVYEQQGALTQARASYLKASETFHKLSDRVSDAAVSFALGRLELKGGNYDAAEAFLKQSLENTELIRSTATGRELTEAFSASVHARYAAYVECLMRKHKLEPSRGLDVMAFQASELARARSLAELLRDTQTNLLTGVDAENAKRVKTLRQMLRAKEDYLIELLARANNKAELAEVETSLTRLREEYQQMLEKIRSHNPAFDRISQPMNYSLQQIQQNVIEDNQTVLLEYFLGAEASYVWLVTSNSFEAFEIPKEAIVAESVNNLYDLLTQEAGAETDARIGAAASELGKMILGPVSNQLAGRRVIVVADGALNYIPFQVLSSGDKLLIEESEVINAPSASILGELRQELSKRRPAERTLAAFGDAVFPSNYAERRDSESGEQFAVEQNDSLLARAMSRDITVRGDSLKPEEIQELFYARLELKNIRDLAGRTSFVATGFDATRQELESTDLSQYSILHLATHGVLDPKRPEKSGFLLSLVDRNGSPQDGFITMTDVYRLKAPVDLVVLSACRTGLGKEVQGEGLIGLTRGFMHAGASSVASSLWRVDDEATTELMKHFYVNMLQKNMTPASALREAQNTIRQDPRWKSPHYWAAFTLQGEYKQKIKVPSTDRTALAVIAGLLIMIGVTVGAFMIFSHAKAQRRKV